MKITELRQLTDAASCPLLVIKVGSALLVGPNGRARREWLGALAGEIAELRKRDQRIIVVSSGAIALGAALLGLEKGGRASLADAQASAAVGQIALAGLWSDKLAGRGTTAAQMLVTLDDLEDRRRYLNAAATLNRLLDAGAVPIVNENDSVATQEIRFGDNDRLAARVAQAAGAQGVLLLSDVDGLYDRDPADPEAVLQPRIEDIDKRVHAMAQGGPGRSGMGSGGMESKIQAAEIATRAGIALGIVNGTHSGPIGRAMNAATEGGRGTIFLPGKSSNVHSETARKAWLGGKLTLAGSVRIDRGCADALKGGASLLAAGIVAVEGDFQRGDAIAINGPEGTSLAHGLAEYDAKKIRKIRGKKTEDHAEILGHAPRAAVVHRDHMVLL
ncbi:MAG: glutamate 5-kinase [Alteripontixanthobacter sp.]